MPTTKNPELLQRSFGFMDDPDSKTPKHDEIMLWLDQNMDDILEDIYSPEWSQEVAQDHFQYARDEYRPGATNSPAASSQLAAAEMPPLPPKPPVEVREKVWADVVKAHGSKDPIGFIDMTVTVHVPFPSLSPEFNEAEQKWIWVWNVGYHTDWIAFMVKSIIDSLGEVIRQIQMYKTYLGPGTGSWYRREFYIVSPDETFADIIRQQHIGFIKYPH